MNLHKGNSDDPALIAPDGVVSYGELNAYIAMCIANFRQAGIGPDCRVALYQPSSQRYIISMLALIEMGAVACPISTRIPESNLQEALDHVQADAVFYADRGLPVGNSNVGSILFDAMEVSIIGEESDAETPALDRWATIISTSGSSGTPKTAVHSFANHIESARASNKNIALRPDNRWLLSLPLFHVGGLGVVFRCLQAGAAIVLPIPDTDLENAVTNSSLTHISLVSTQLYRLLQSNEATAKLANMKAVLMGGSAMPPQLIESAISKNIPIHTSYGMTEMTTQITCTRPGATATTLRSSGSPLIPDNCRIGDHSEIQVTGPTLFQGYLQRGHLALPLTQDEWFATGDRGAFDDEGHLHVFGRTDNLFISGGENIQPEEIEDALCQLEGILQAVVIPIENEEFGHRPVAFIRTEMDWNEDKFKSKLRETLSGFKIPDQILPWPEDAMAEGMKIDRKHFYDFLG